MCIARLGCSYDDLVHIDFALLLSALKDWANTFNLQQRNNWEQSRFVAFYVVNIQLKKKDRYKKPQDFVKFSWEAKLLTKKAPPKEKALSVFERLDKFRQKLLGNG